MFHLDSHVSYLMCASVVGLYSSPGLHLLLPKARDTPMTKLIVNCVILLLLSSALPLMASTLGETLLCMACTVYGY